MSTQAIAIELEGARLPRPTRALWREMARAAYIAVRIHARSVDDKHLPPYDSLEPHAIAALEVAAHAAYAIVAVRGGGAVRDITPPDKAAPPRRTR